MDRAAVPAQQGERLRPSGRGTPAARILSDVVSLAGYPRGVVVGLVGILLTLVVALMWRLRRKQTLVTERDERETPAGDTSVATAAAKSEVRVATVQPQEDVTSGDLYPVAASLTIAGQRLKGINQDNILVWNGTIGGSLRSKPYGLFVVADGMRGPAEGAESSRRVVEVIGTHVTSMLNSRAQPAGPAWYGQCLAHAIELAHDEVRTWGAEHQVNSGATATAVLVADGAAYVANVGDSRTYLFDPAAGLRQLTVDHSVISTLIANGLLEPEAIYSHPRRHLIYRGLGGPQASVRVDLLTAIVRPGEQLLLCSDGLWQEVRDAEIEAILRWTTSPRQAAEQLMSRATQHGGWDDMSVVVVEIEHRGKHPQTTADASAAATAEREDLASYTSRATRDFL